MDQIIVEFLKPDQHPEFILDFGGNYSAIFAIKINGNGRAEIIVPIHIM